MQNNKKKREIPHVLVILVTMILIATAATWLIPAGVYERVLDPATGRMVIDPASFQYVDKSPVGFFGLFLSLEEGLIEAANITFMIFAAFSCLYLLEKTGAIDAAIAMIVKFTKKHPGSTNAVIVVIMAALAVWGSTGTMSYEEIIAFIPIFVAISIALGYDAIVGIAISVIPVGIGFASATVNPFTIGVAQTIAELPLYSGLGYRVIILAVMTAMLVVYTLAYAKKIKKDPTKSLTYGIDYSDLAVDEERMNTEMTLPRKLSLLSLLIAVAVMGWGLITQGWYINQVAAIFMILAIVVGVINRWSANKIATTWVEGLSRGVLSAITVGVARAVLTVLNKGNVVDSIIHGCVELLEDMSLYASSFGMLIFQTILNLFVPSGSGQATVAMPVMTPIADILGLNRQIAVLIFQFGDGFSNLIWPTSFMVIACAAAKIPLGKYYKWLLPMMGICFVLQCIFVFAAIAFGYC